MSNVSRGRYHALKTKEWLESQGYTVAPLEMRRSIFIPAKNGKPSRMVFQVNDTWGSDLMARDEDHFIFIQVKANRGHVSRGVKELSEGPWPPFVGRWVVHWPDRRRMKDGPEIEVVS